MTWKCLPTVALATLLLIPGTPVSAQDTTPGQTVSPPQTAPESPEPAPAAPPAESPAEPDAGATNDARAIDGDPLAISPEVVLLRVVGPWKDGDRRGFSRVVARVSGGELKLYVQWIDQAGGIAQSAEIDGAEGVPQLALAEVRVDAGGEDSAVYFDTPADAQGFRETYVLIIERLGEARFGPATN
jgi:hypothetical protein